MDAFSPVPTRRCHHDGAGRVCTHASPRFLLGSFPSPSPDVSGGIFTTDGLFSLFSDPLSSVAFFRLLASSTDNQCPTVTRNPRSAYFQCPIAASSTGTGDAYSNSFPIGSPGHNQRYARGIASSSTESSLFTPLRRPAGRPHPVRSQHHFRASHLHSDLR